MKTKIFVAIILFIIVLGVIAIYTLNDKTTEPKYKTLSSNQISKMIDIGVLQVYLTLPENIKDKNTKLIYETSYGKCYIYQDLFGRYYCRWQ